MPKIYTDLTSLREDLQAYSDKLPDDVIDNLAYSANLASHEDIRIAAHKAIRTYAPKHDVHTTSIHDLYMAFADGKLSGFTVPALNIRTLTYDIAHRLFTCMIKHSIGPVIFEIAVSEQEYTSQPPAEYATSILAGAMKARYTGPVFLLGDHYQLHSTDFRADKSSELKRIEDIIRTSIKAGFYNIDIDGSTLVDLKPESKIIQQKDNYEVTSYFAKMIRKLQPDNINIAIGAEIGHIGGINSTPEDLEAFLEGFSRIYDSSVGLAKIAIQTGTSHGGSPKEDGSLETVEIDTSLHTSIGTVAREHGIGGTVQHGASTLPLEKLNGFPSYGALEIHLATGWQNIVYDHMSPNRRESMYTWMRDTLQGERKSGWTDQQFIYKVRKRAFGQFKIDMWQMDYSEKLPILNAIESTFQVIAEKLNIYNTRDIVKEYSNTHHE